MLDGFLGTRATAVLDLVVLAMVAVLPVMAWSIWLARFRKNYALHKRIQLTLGVVLAVALALFETDIRLFGWEHRAESSPFFSSSDAWNLVYRVLYVHLCFAVTTAVLWIAVIYRALRRFANPPVPGEHSASHIFWARLAAIDMTLTAVTGWLFYGLAFWAT